MRPGQDVRIAHLFRRGHSLDLVSELGLLYGWTREDAKTVLAMNGWALNWSGRLQPQYMRGAFPMGVESSVALADPERLLNAGIDHEVTEIRKAAVGVERALEKLRSALLRKEEHDARQAELATAVDVLADAFRGSFGTSGPAEDLRVS